MAADTRIRIGGIKFSEELAHITVRRIPRGSGSFAEILRLLASRHINVPFICHAGMNTSTAGSFCVLQDALGQVREVLPEVITDSADINIIEGAGTLTIFPHRNSFRLVGLVLGTLSRHRLPVHSLSTSISALAVNTDFPLLDTAADLLADVLALPENHAPFRQEFRLTQLV